MIKIWKLKYLDTMSKTNFLEIFRMYLNVVISFFLRWEDDYKHEVCTGCNYMGFFYVVAISLCFVFMFLKNFYTLASFTILLI